MTDRLPGKLYVISTPIGNLKDITYRAVEILSHVSLVAVEDTRRSRILFQEYGIKTPVISYYEHNRLTRIPAIIKTLNSGVDVGLITDAGTPGISDPAYKLIRAAIDEKVEIIPIPGPTAVTTALVASGLPTDRFLFEGFLPPRKGRQKRLRMLESETATIILYESPHRLPRTLNDLLSFLGDRPAVVGRELTKIHESIYRGTLSSLASYFNLHSIKGECVILVGKNKENVFFN
ncbi:MAG: 16S rRNA (cytidine(1402)-2'-O)-methyltransferase [Fidelibacterota bacterium]